MRAGPLIRPQELASAGAAPVVLDVRWQLGGPPGRELYAAGHLPGAVFVDLDRELAGPPETDGRHPLPDALAFGAAMRAKGVSAGRPVVVYDAANATTAARAWWLLRYFGHPDARVLDGGLAAWRAAGYPVTEEASEPTPGDFQPAAGAMPLLDADGAARVAIAGRLLDARTPDRYRGEQEPIDLIAGHIPGAHNHPAALNVDADGRFLGPDELAARLDIPPGLEVGAYCGSGVTAAHTVLALELIGVRSALYVGSWSEWIRDSRRPLARG